MLQETVSGRERRAPQPRMARAQSCSHSQIGPQTGSGIWPLHSPTTGHTAGGKLEVAQRIYSSQQILNESSHRLKVNEVLKT